LFIEDDRSDGEEITMIIHREVKNVVNEGDIRESFMLKKKIYAQIHAAGVTKGPFSPQMKQRVGNPIIVTHHSIHNLLPKQRGHAHAL